MHVFITRALQEHGVEHGRQSCVGQRKVNNMEELIKFTTEVALEAGIFIKKKLNTVHTIEYKGEINLVTEVDTASEEIITSRIRQRFPDHDILAEEFTRTHKGSDFQWVIDPLDGTTNFAHGFPFFCVSIALKRRNEVIVGVVYNPVMDEMFWAERGKGTYLNARRIQVSQTEKIIESFMATGFPYDLRESSSNNLNYFNAMMLNARAVRRAGSAALDLAYVATGCFDGYWEIKLNPWDTAAGWILVEEAGGMVTDMNGEGYYLDSPEIVASNGRIHAEMLSILKQAPSI